ncbi:MAG: glycosyltransferase [Sphingopyxis sp.]|uniref:beta-1,4-glucuronosyltransferase WelK n=1 Tax=Sphingopyxis sp. TaxID=1908224 RepID=UPI002ABBA267|nr:glycosyltransferase [Sphingopyxis sp.]MDZ3833671.1 glycosyltransferase [Sphingopyxis sp.]
MSSLKICLAASGGGHIRQLLDLLPAVSEHQCFFMTESTALGQSINSEFPTYFVEHVALGQARLGNPFKMITAAARNAMQSFRVIRRERPQIILSTGAGSMAFAMLWGRLFGAKLVLIDSFARVQAPSAFARIVGPIAHHRVAQSQGATGGRADIPIFDPFRVIDEPRPEKQDLLFATVGATLPFDRLVAMVASAERRGLTPTRVLAQVGEGGAMPEGLDAVAAMTFDRIRQTLKDADIVVCHAGTGSLITALQAGCHVIAVPRLFELREHYDDHQLEIAGALAERGLVQVARNQAEFDAALLAAKTRKATMATTDPQALIGFLRQVIGGDR